MIRLWRQIIKGEKGQALPIVLAFLVLGGFVIVPLLNNASTSINASRGIEENVRSIYAAEAGVEQALWSIRNSVPPLGQLPENVNRMQVTIDTDNKGPYTLAYYDIIIESEEHADWIFISGDMVPEGEVYKYTITVSLNLEKTTSTVHLEEVGVRLPVGYEYVTDSAADFTDNNLSIDEPSDTLDYADAHMLSWELPPPRPSVSSTEPTQYQRFYVDGEGEVQGDYTWIKAAEKDIATVGEVTGNLYRITATATSLQDSEIEARIIADFIHDEGTGETRIIYWQVSPQ